MSKKRKTRREKMILQLKRELGERRRSPVLPGTKFTPRQEPVLPPPPLKPVQVQPDKKTDASILFYDPSLVKRDLLKTLALTIIVLAVEFVLYWKLG